jgi:hypothetical protein
MTLRPILSFLTGTDGAPPPIEISISAMGSNFRRALQGLTDEPGRDLLRLSGFSGAAPLVGRADSDDFVLLLKRRFYLSTILAPAVRGDIQTQGATAVIRARPEFTPSFHRVWVRVWSLLMLAASTGFLIQALAGGSGGGAITLAFLAAATAAIAWQEWLNRSTPRRIYRYILAAAQGSRPTS